MSELDIEVFLTDDLDLVVRPTDKGQIDPYGREYTCSLDNLLGGVSGRYQLDETIDSLIMTLDRLKQYRDDVYGEDGA